MTPEAKARQIIDKKLIQSGWLIQDLRQINLSAGVGIAVREFPTGTGPVDYALFVEGRPVGVLEAKKTDSGENLTTVEEQSSRYAHSTLKYVGSDYRIRFAYEATDKLIRFTDYDDIKFRSRKIYSFHRPETLRYYLSQPDTIRNYMKQFPPLDETGFRKCQITAIKNLDQSLADNRPRALVQMATGAGKTFTAITAAYRMLKYGRMRRVLFLVDTKSLGEQAEREFLAYTPNDDARSFSQLYGVRRLKSSYIPGDVQICISTIQRMYSILRGEELDESAEEVNFAELKTANKQPRKEVVYNAKYPPEFFDCIIVDECHRSIYNVWSQVLSYFDSFIIGLTATPDKRTFAYFNQNVVSEYSREQAIVDGVNVGEDIFLIDTEVTKTVQIIKLSETAMSCFGILPINLEEGATIKPTASKPHKIEFIGDSITCGYGVDDENPTHGFATSTEDVTRAYAYKTAQNLGADYSMFSISGWGIISGWTGNGEQHPEQQIPLYYEKQAFSYGGFDDVEAQSLDWDFSHYQPELVVINLGTNDDSYCKSDEDKRAAYVAGYVEFLKTVRKNNPDARIVCTLGIMGDNLYPCVEKAVADYSAETGDANISAFHLEPQEPEDGLVADYHPTETTHTKAADALTAEIKRVMGW